MILVSISSNTKIPKIPRLIKVQLASEYLILEYECHFIHSCPTQISSCEVSNISCVIKFREYMFF